MRNLDTSRAKRILLAQVFATCMVGLLAGVHSLDAAFCAGLGGGIATAANAVFALWVFGRYRAQQPGRLVAGFYGGELAKLLFVAGAFALTTILLRDLNPVALFGGFLAVQVLPVLLVNKFAG